MKTRVLSLLLLTLLVSATCAADDKPAAPAKVQPLEQELKKLVDQLNDNDAPAREEAEKKLLELAGTNTTQADAFLLALPKDNDEMPLAVRDKLARLRQDVEDRVAKGTTAATTVTLSAKDMPLNELLKEIEKQTGNKLIDNRDNQDDKDAKSSNVTIELKNEPFWPAIDQILDQAQLGVYSYGGEEALSIVGRASNDGSRKGMGVYQGPFRIEVLETQAAKNRRKPKENAMKVQLEVAWEPRLRPIALSQPADDLQATADSGAELTVSQPENLQEVEIPSGTQAAEIVLPFELPARDVKKIASLRGKLHALVPGRHVKFQFDNLAQAAGKSQSLGGVRVTFDEIRKNGAVWEVHMRFAIDDANDAVQSHRAWVFQNLSYLVGKDGKNIDNAGFETTRQTPTEVGMAYLFDTPDGIDGLSWVYETPAAIVELPVEYEIKDIELP